MEEMKKYIIRTNVDELMDGINEAKKQYKNEIDDAALRYKNKVNKICESIKSELIEING
jgi:hypothetical protein